LNPHGPNTISAKSQQVHGKPGGPEKGPRTGPFGAADAACAPRKKIFLSRKFLRKENAMF
jgi:hypothetical protein